MPKKNNVYPQASVILLKLQTMQVALILLFSLILALNSAYAQVVPLANEDFTEHYSSDVPVSGKVLVGILIESKNVNSRFFVKSSAGTNLFCFQVNSIDGTYFSENEYLLTSTEKLANEQGLVEVEYPTQFKKILKEFGDNELALLATEGSCDSQSNLHFVATKDKIENSDKVRFLISSARSQVFMRLKSNIQSIQPTCARIEEGKRTAYDTICEINLSELVSESFDGQIIRRKNNRTLDNVNFSLSIASQ